jgi:hypothetical protein
VERRVVSQLALAHERQLIQDGSSIRLTVENANHDRNLTKSNGGSSDCSPPAIKLQLINKGTAKDLRLDSDAAKFFSSEN